jgi:hypothetical protein
MQNTINDVQESINEKGEKILMLDGIIATWSGSPDIEKVSKFIIEQYFKNKSLCNE